MNLKFTLILPFEQIKTTAFDLILPAKLEKPQILTHFLNLTLSHVIEGTIDPGVRHVKRLMAFWDSEGPKAVHGDLMGRSWAQSGTCICVFSGGNTTFFS